MNPVLQQRVIDFVNSGGELPCEFSRRTSLYDDMRRISGYAAKFADVISADMVPRCLKKLSKAGKHSISAEAVSNTNSLGTKLGEKVFNMFNNVKSLTSAVETLATKINEKYNRHMAANPLTAKLTDNKPEFKTMDWSIVEKEFAMIDLLLDNITAKYNLVKSSTVERNNERLYQSLRDNAMTDNFKNIKLSNELRDDLGCKLKEKFPELSDAERAECIKVYTDSVEATRVARRIVSILGTNKNYANNAIAVMQHIKELYSTGNALQSHLFNFSTEMKADIVANAEAMCAYLEAGAYYVIQVKNHILNDAVILDNGMLEPKNYAEFQKNEEFGKVDTIVNHLHYMYSKLDIPVKGISADSLFKTAKRFAERAERDAIVLQKQIKEAKAEYMLNAMESICNSYLKEHHSQVIKGVDFTSVVKNFATQKINKDIPLEDSLYNLLFNLMEQDPMVENIHQRITEQYVAACESATEIKPEDIAQIDANVAIDLVLDIIFAKFC